MISAYRDSIVNFYKTRLTLANVLIIILIIIMLCIKHRFFRIGGFIMRTFLFIILVCTFILIMGQIASAADPTILWLKFDESFKQEVNDMSGLDNNGNVVGAVSYVKDGKIGGAAKFTGGTITVKTSDTINVEQNLTIEFWVRPDKVPAATYWRLLHKGWVSNGSYICGIDNNWMVMGYTWDITNTAGVRTDANMAGIVQNETWNYYTATYDGKKVVLYLDGKQQVETPANGKISGGADIIIAEGYMGMLDEIRFSSVVLTPDEIKSHMEGEKAQAVGSSDKLATTWAGVKSGF